MKPLTIMFVLLAALPLAVMALFAQVRLAWDQNTEASVVGYRVHAGTNAREYFIVSNVVGRANTTGEVELPFPAVWHFAVTATNIAGLESGYSDEVIYRSELTAPVMRGDRYVKVTPKAERSANMIGWQPMQMEPTLIPATNAQEFYRVTGLAIESVKIVNTND